MRAKNNIGLGTVSECTDQKTIQYINLKLALLGFPAVVAGPDLVSRGFIEGEADNLFDEAREHTTALLAKVAPDADYTVWQSAIHEGLSRFLYRRTRRRPLILPLVTEI